MNSDPVEYEIVGDNHQAVASAIDTVGNASLNQLTATRKMLEAQLAIQIRGKENARALRARVAKRRKKTIAERASRKRNR